MKPLWFTVWVFEADRMIFFARGRESYEPTWPVMPKSFLGWRDSGDCLAVTFQASRPVLWWALWSLYQSASYPHAEGLSESEQT